MNIKSTHAAHTVATCMTCAALTGLRGAESKADVGPRLEGHSVQHICVHVVEPVQPPRRHTYIHMIATHTDR